MHPYLPKTCSIFNGQSHLLSLIIKAPTLVHSHHQLKGFLRENMISHFHGEVLWEDFGHIFVIRDGTRMRILYRGLDFSVELEPNFLKTFIFPLLENILNDETNWGFLIFMWACIAQKSSRSVSSRRVTIFFSFSLDIVDTVIKIWKLY